MNIFVVTEGRGDKYLYKSWIPYVNPNITYVDCIVNITDNNFSIVHSFGNPYYFRTIDKAIEDVNDHGNIDRLVISVDSEELSLQDKQSEIRRYLASKSCSASKFVIIQHFCIETWALGNKRACPVNPNSQALLTFKNLFDVRILDPELLPPYPPRKLNRAQFAEVYLRSMLQDRNMHLSYNKSRPKPLRRLAYFNQIRLRYQNTNHIASFNSFLNAFV